MVERQRGGRFEVRRPFKLGRDAPAKMAARDITPDEVRNLLDDHVIVDVVADRDRYVLLGRVEGRPLIAVLADENSTTRRCWCRSTSRTRPTGGQRTGSNAAVG